MNMKKKRKSTKEIHWDEDVAEILEEERRENADFLEEIETDAGGTSNSKMSNGVRFREIDISEIPSHVLQNFTPLRPQKNVSLLREDFEDTDEAWIIQCPKDIDLANLLTGKKIHLDGRQTILEAGDKPELEDDNLDQSSMKYEANVVSRGIVGESAFLLLPGTDGSFQIVSAPLQGKIQIRQHLEDLPLPQIKHPRRKPHKLPSGIKERHPIYGIDFSHALSSKKVTKSPKKVKHKEQYEEQVIEESSFSAFKASNRQAFFKSAMQSSVEEPELSPRKKSKKKSRQVDVQVDDFVQDVTPEVPYERKSKKRRMQDSAYELDQEVSYSLSAIKNNNYVEVVEEHSHRESKKAKRHKRDRESREVETEAERHSQSEVEDASLFKSHKSSKKRKRDLVQ